MLKRSVIDEKYIERCSNYSDINEHLPTLARYASECSHITECGVRCAVSSYAFAHALKNKKNNKIIQVDIESNENIDLFKSECANENVNVTFYKQSSLECPIEQTDLLFIDTWHVYGQLKRELERWNTSVSKYIIMHDTTVDEWAGETIRLKWNPKEQSQQSGIPIYEITKGLWPAIREFLESHPEWKLRERYSNNNGLTILERITPLILEEKERIYPISFAIPKCKVKDDVIFKRNVFGRVIPGDASSYIFDNEKMYYSDYSQSIFGITKRKHGWDCLRHYEIMANGSIPYFENLSECPKNVMTHLPKELIRSAMQDIVVSTDNVIGNNLDTIYKYSKEVLDYTRENLTTEKMASYILKTSNNENAKSILYISHNTDPDYLRCLMLHGFKELFKTKCHDIPRIPHLYTDFKDALSLYGKGFTYSCLLDPIEYRDSTQDSNIIEDIKNKKYDVIIYGSLHRGMPHWDIVNKSYSKDNIIVLCGEDGCNGDCSRLGKEGYHSFIREFNY